MSSYAVSLEEFNAHHHGQCEGHEAYVDCSEFRRAILSRLDIDYRDEYCTEAKQDHILNFIKRNLCDELYDDILAQHGEFNAFTLEAYLMQEGAEAAAHDRYIQNNLHHIDVNGRIGLYSELDMLYHLAVYKIHGDENPSPCDQFRAETALADFELIWHPSHGWDRFPHPFVREIDYFRPDGAPAEAGRLRYTLDGEDIRVTYGQGESYTDYTDMPEVVTNVATIGARRVASIMGSVEAADGGLDDDEIRDVLEISWDPSRSQTDDPGVVIRSWYGDNTPQGQVLRAQLARMAPVDRDGDGKTDAYITHKRSPYQFANKSAEHPDGIDESQRPDQPNGRVGLRHTNLGVDPYQE